MADFIKPKRLSFAEEMGVASKSTGKKLDVTSIKPKDEKLMEINSEAIDVTAIQSQVDKVAINTSPADNTKIVSNKEIAKELEPDYIKPLSPNIWRQTDGRQCTKYLSATRWTRWLSFLQVCIQIFWVNKTWLHNLII